MGLFSKLADYSARGLMWGGMGQTLEQKLALPALLGAGGLGFYGGLKIMKGMSWSEGSFNQMTNQYQAGAPVPTGMAGAMMAQPMTSGPQNFSRSSGFGASGNLAFSLHNQRKS